MNTSSSALTNQTKKACQKAPPAPETGFCGSQISLGTPVGRHISLELLRLFAMFLIVAHHFIFHNAQNVMDLEPSIPRVFLLVLAYGGKLGKLDFIEMQLQTRQRKRPFAVFLCLYLCWFLESFLTFARDCRENPVVKAERKAVRHGNAVLTDGGMLFIE